MLNQIQKKQIAALVQAHVECCKSQNEAAHVLDVSAATISQIRAGNWQNIDDKMWLKVGKQLGFQQGEWNTVLTRPAHNLRLLLNDAANWSMVYAITGDPGLGKSHIAREFAQRNGHTFHIVCNEFWNKKQFLQELLATMGTDPSGMSAHDMINKIVDVVLGLENPLIIIDEADKLNDGALYLFITLYNKLEDKCGIVLMATDHLEKRINKGRRLNRKGFKEIFSRLGRKFINLPPIEEKDVDAVCKANGIDSTVFIKQIWNDSEGDLRRVKRKIHALRHKGNQAA